jgi:hypothetical protein
VAAVETNTPKAIQGFSPIIRLLFLAVIEKNGSDDF